MSDLTLILIVLAVALAILGAIRFDLLGLILQEFRRPPLDASPPEPVARVPPAAQPHGHASRPHAADKPAIHRSGRRH